MRCVEISTSFSGRVTCTALLSLPPFVGSGFYGVAIYEIGKM